MNILNKWFCQLEYSPRKVLSIILLLAALVRLDVFWGTKDIYGYISLTSHEAAAFSFAKGWGLRIAPIDKYFGDRSRIIHPYEYLPQTEELTSIDPNDLPLFNFNPGLPILLGIFFKYFGWSYHPYQIFQLIITWLQIIAIYWISKKIFNKQSVALLSAAFYAFCLQDIRFSMYIGREIYSATAMICSIAGALAISYSYPAKKSIPTALVIALCTGVIIGLCTLFRSTALPFGATFILSLIISRGLKKGLLFGTTSILGLLITLSPWLWRNYQQYGKPFISQESQALALWGGQGYGTNSVGLNATDTVSFQTTQLWLSLHGQVSGNYYKGNAAIYEEAAKSLFKEYALQHTHTLFLSFLKNLQVNLTSHTEWAYASWEETSLPKFKLLGKILPHGAIKVINRGYKIFIDLIGIFSIPGIVLAFIYFRRSYMILIPFTLSLTQISLAASHVDRYTHHLLIFQLVFASLFLYLLGLKMRRFSYKTQPKYPLTSI